MQYRNGLSALGFGCMRFPSSPEKVEELVLEAVNSGINYFDTAYIYSGNERALGAALNKLNLRDKVNIATKLPTFLCFNNGDFDKLFNKQLSRLKTDYIDYYLIHMLNNPAQWQGLCALGIEKWILEKKASGKIKNIGFSYHGKQSDFNELIDAYNWDFCMIQYNYLDVNNQAGLKGLKYANSKGLPVMIMEPLRGGLLANPKQLPPDVVKIFEEAETNPASLALKWVWNHSEVTLLLSGMNTIAQLRENVKSAEASGIGALSESELNVIQKATDAFNKANSVPCTGCSYCMPCPAGVNIPGCFAAYNAYCNNKKAYNQYVLNTAAFLSKNGTAGGCVGCGKCETRCPQSISIQESLKTIRKRMEPLWFRIGMPIARKFMSRRVKKT